LAWAANGFDPAGKRLLVEACQQPLSAALKSPSFREFKMATSRIRARSHRGCVQAGGYPPKAFVVIYARATQKPDFSHWISPRGQPSHGRNSTLKSEFASRGISVSLSVTQAVNFRETWSGDQSLFMPTF
jgi:hypothetical protein